MSLCQITQEIITQNVDDQFLNKLVNNTSHYLLNKIDIEKKKSNKKNLHRYGTQGPPPEA